MNEPFDFVSCENSAEVLDRIIQAYGFSSKIMLADHFDMAASSLSGRYKRPIFPADMVVRCLYETKVNIDWLIFGQGNMFDSSKADILTLENHRIINGKLHPASRVMFDKVLFTKNEPLPSDPICVQNEKDFYIVERKFSDVFDGRWLVDIEGKVSVRDLTRIPIKRVRVTGVGIPFDCDLTDLTVIGRVVKEVVGF